MAQDGRVAVQDIGFNHGLHGQSWPAQPFDGGPGVLVTPQFHHLVYHQFTQYSDCRLRYSITDHGPELNKFLTVLKEHPDKLEELLSPHLSCCYLEGRAAGANFPGQEIMDLAGENVAASVVVSPTAVHYGLLRNLERTKRLVAGHAWSDLLGLREEAARHALNAEYHGIKAWKICADVLEIAGEGLNARQAWMLDYPQWVLHTGKTGADRALQRYEVLPGLTEERFRRLILERRMIPV